MPKQPGAIRDPRLQFNQLPSVLCVVEVSLTDTEKEAFLEPTFLEAYFVCLKIEFNINCDFANRLPAVLSRSHRSTGIENPVFFRL